ncbi:MAG: T9SS type A sorting domain-containing protein [Bacteroidales bacterium]|nr:T9SS type A sorting domain-containing protein [Bacteroidales bacterium]
MKSLKGEDIIGLDIKGSECAYNRHLTIKFEDGTTHSAFKWEHLAKLNRWGKKLALLKSQFGSYKQFKWDSISVVSFDVSSPGSDYDVLPDSGVITICNLVADSVENWTRADSLESLVVTSQLKNVAHKAIRGMLQRQDITGLFQTWQEDSTANLYGQGLLLKLLSSDIDWLETTLKDSMITAAGKLALFLVNNQEKEGFWPRGWNANSGDIVYHLEHDSTIWMGDFPWIITGLQNYFNATGDERVQFAIHKARNFLYSLIDSIGKFYTLNPISGQKKEVTSVEAYAAAILSVYELGDSVKAETMLNYIDKLTWDDELKYWHEATGSSRIVLFANTWMAMLAKNIPGMEHKATNALSFVGKALHTRGPGAPEGFDGIGPIATWYEGTLTYISAGGAGGKQLLDSLLPFRYPGGTIPHYNDSVSVAGIWAVPWSSIDGTSWLCYTAMNKSPFERHTTYRNAIGEPKKVLMHTMGWYGDGETGRHWNDGHVRTPLIGYYNSQHWSTQLYQVLISHACGIDGMVMNLKDMYDAQSVYKMLGTIKMLQEIDSINFNYEFAISFDDQGMDQQYPYDTAMAVFQQFKDSLQNHQSSYLHFFDKPTVFVYNYDGKYLSASSYDSVITAVFDSVKPCVLWNEIKTDAIVYTDGSYPWVGPDNTGWHANGLNWGKKYLEWYYPESNLHTYKQDMVIGGVWPGFDDRPCSWGASRWMDRQNGVVYDSTWSFVQNYNQQMPLSWVLMETWNDWNEGTEIEPSEELGYQYLKATIKNVNTFKGTTISEDTCKFVSAGKIYHAAQMIEKHEIDSSIYMTLLNASIQNLLQNNCDSADYFTDCILSDCLSIGNETKNESRSFAAVYPNPSIGHVNIVVSMENPKYELSIYSIKGELFVHKAITSTKTYVNISGFPQGGYIVRIMNNQEVFYTNFIKN